MQLQRQEYNDAERGYPHDNDKRGNQLGTHLVSTIKPPIPAHTRVRIPEDAKRHYSPETARPMHRDGVDYIVYLQHDHEHRYGLVDQATHKANDQGLPWLHKRTPSGDSDEACQNAVAKTTDTRSQGGVHRDEASLHCIPFRVHLQRASGIEAIPTKPKAESSENNERDIVRIEFLCRVGIKPTMPGSDDDSSAESAYATSHVNETAACEVHVCWTSCGGLAISVNPEPTSPAPPPIGDDWVDETGHCDDVDGEALQLRALRHRTTHNRPSRGAEGALKEPCPECCFIIPEPVHEKVGEASKLAWVLCHTECEGVTDDVPTEKTYCHDNEVLGEDVLCVLEAHAARLQ